MARLFDEPPRPEFQFGVASVVPAEFLNQLDDLLYAFGDSILPTHTGSQVFIQATAGDEAQVAIDRRYFISASALYEPVAGDAGVYDLYAVASYVPTSHATTVKSFELAIATEPPTDYAYTRHIAQVDFDGTLITDVRQDPHKLNAAQLDGHIASRDPSDGDVVPVASSNGKLDRRFRPRFPGVDVELGDVIDWWVPPGVPVVLPELFEFCMGQALGPDEQDISTATIVLPNLVDKLVVGADADTAFGTSSGAVDSPAGAPGVGGGKASHFGGVGNHTHALPTHTHQFPHHHQAGHIHFINDHDHDLNRGAVSHGVYADPPWGFRKRANALGSIINYQPDPDDQLVERGFYSPHPSDTAGFSFARGADVVFDVTTSGMNSYATGPSVDPGIASQDTNVSTPNTTSAAPNTTPAWDTLAAGGAASPNPLPLVRAAARIMRVRD